MDTKFLLTTIGFAFLFAASAFAREESLLARITVYWPGEGQLRACSNGARLRAGHCAVDPKRIPYGSHVVFPDATCTAVDSGPAVVSRKAARMTGRTISQRNAIVIDRFFESKEAALSWESRDRKSTRLNSSHVRISYAVFCLKKKRLTPITSLCTKSIRTPKLLVS